MAMNDDYMDQLSMFSDRFAQCGLKAYQMYERVLGTQVTVTKHKDSVNEDADRYNRLLKGAMNINSDGSKLSNTSFETRLLINRSQMGNRFTKSTEELSITYTKDLFSIGDILSFRYMGTFYKFKVTNLEDFGLQDNVIHRMTLQPFRETK